MKAVDLISEDTGLIIYRPSLREITGSVTSAILLAQMIYYANCSDDDCFYKFKMPCEHRLYTQGDSWCEILGFSRTEFDNALKLLKDKGLVATKITAERLTFYSVNFDKIESELSKLLTLKTSFTKSKKLAFCKVRNSLFEKREISFSTYTENNTKTYTKKGGENFKQKSDDFSAKKEKISELKNQKVDEKKSPSNEKISELILPNFLDKKVWADYLDYKKARKEKLLPQSLKAKIEIFKKWHSQGIDVNQAIIESIANGYQGIFPPKQNKATSKSQSVANAVNDFLADDDYSNAEVLL